MRFLTLFIFAFFSISVMATPEYSWHTSKLELVYPTNDGNVILKFKDPSDCPKENGYHYMVVGESGMTEQGLKNMLSVVLSAGAMDKRVAVNFDKADPNCAINRLYVSF